MTEEWFQILKHRVEKFVSNASDADLDRAFEKADYQFYKNVTTPILWYNDKGNAFAFSNLFKLSVKSCALKTKKRQRPEFKNFEKADDYSSYNYLIAA